MTCCSSGARTARTHPLVHITVSQDIPATPIPCFGGLQAGPDRSYRASGTNALPSSRTVSRGTMERPYTKRDAVRGAGAVLGRNSHYRGSRVRCSGTGKALGAGLVAGQRGYSRSDMSNPGLGPASVRRQRIHTAHPGRMRRAWFLLCVLPYCLLSAVNGGLHNHDLGVGVERAGASGRSGYGIVLTCSQPREAECPACEWLASSSVCSVGPASTLQAAFSAPILSLATPVVCPVSLTSRSIRGPPSS